MKKGILIFLAIAVVGGGSIFLGLRYIEQQRVDARVALDRSFDLMDRTKDDFDEIKGTASPITVKKVNDLYVQILPKLDQAEKAFLDKRYSEAISLADEALILTNEAKSQFNGKK